MIQKALVLLFFVSIIKSGHSQLLPWFFNTEPFRKWTQENNVQTLLLNEYEPVQIRKGYGYSHNSHLSSGRDRDYINLTGHFRKYTIDRSGYIKSMTIVEVDLQYPKVESSLSNTTHYKNLMERMASTDYRPEKEITNKSEYYGALWERFVFPERNAMVESLGWRITSSGGVIYRESGSNAFNEETQTFYNYDVRVNQHVVFQQNIPISVVSYSCLGDFYEPITNEMMFRVKNDTSSYLELSGKVSNGFGEFSIGDTTYRLHPFKFETKWTTYSNGGIGSNLIHSKSDSVRVFGYGSCNQPINEEDCEPIIVNAVSLCSKRKVDRFYHSLLFTETLSNGYPFTLDSWNSETFVSLVMYRGNRFSGQEAFLKTEKTRNRHGVVVKIAHSYLDTKTNQWQMVIEEEYDAQGHLKRLKTGMIRYAISPFSNFGERSDLGFMVNYLALEECEISFDENNQFSIVTKDGATIVRTSADQLIIGVPKNSSEFSYSGFDPDYFCGDYCPSNYLIIR